MVLNQIQRYLLREILQNALLTFAVVMSVFFLIAVALSMGQSKFEDIPFWVVFHWTAHQSISTLFLIIPMTALTACLFTYGRVLVDGEFTAIQVAGVHPYRAIAPALVFGLLLTLALVWLQDRVMPDAKLNARRELTADVFRNLESILQRGSALSSKTWKARWSGRRKDEWNELLLTDLELLEFDRKGRVEQHYYAKIAKPSLDEEHDVLSLELHDLRAATMKKGKEQQGVASVLSVDLPFSAISASQNPRRDDENRSYEELLTRYHRKTESAAVAATEQQRLEDLEDSRGSYTTLHFRIAFAFSSVLFAFFGASLGLAFGFRHRVAVFVTGFLLVVVVYYPLEMFGRWLAVKGHLPAPVALWIGNAVLLALGLKFYRRVVHT